MINIYNKGKPASERITVGSAQANYKYSGGNLEFNKHVNYFGGAVPPQSLLTYKIEVKLKLKKGKLTEDELQKENCNQGFDKIKESFGKLFSNPVRVVPTTSNSQSNLQSSTSQPQQQQQPLTKKNLDKLKKQQEEKQQGEKQQGEKQQEEKQQGEKQQGEKQQGEKQQGEKQQGGTTKTPINGGKPTRRKKGTTTTKKLKKTRKFFKKLLKK